MTPSNLTEATSAILAATTPQESEELANFDRNLSFVAERLGREALTSAHAIKALMCLHDAREHAARAFDPRTPADRMAEATGAMESLRELTRVEVEGEDTEPEATDTVEPEDSGDADVPERSRRPKHEVPDEESPDETAAIEAATAE